MPVDYIPLLKVIDLERRKGLNNTAVYGGLDRFLKEWHRKALIQASSPQERELLEYLALDRLDYAHLKEDERRQKLDEIVALAKSHPQKSVDLPAKPQFKTMIRKFNVDSLEAPISVIPGINKGIAGKFENLVLGPFEIFFISFPIVILISPALRILQTSLSGWSKLLLLMSGMSIILRSAGKGAPRLLLGILLAI